jgi:hypothetical protein
VENRRQDQPKYSRPEAAGSHDDSGTHSPQTLFFIRLEKLFDLWEDIFGDLLQFVSVLNLTNFFRNGAADLLASRHG